MSFIDVKLRIMAAYEQMTATERNVADYFLHNECSADFSFHSLAKQIYVSEATLSRFAQKCGYKGFRELMFSCQADAAEDSRKEDISDPARKVKGIYWELLEASFALLDEAQIGRVTDWMTRCRRVFVYGMGSSGFAARDIQLRFMRIGLPVAALTDSQIMRMNSVLLGAGDLVLAVSLSGQTREVLRGALLAKQHGAGVILLTANASMAEKERFDEVLPLAAIKDLEGGSMISPQFPVLVMADILFTHYFAQNPYQKMKKYTDTLAALQLDS